MGQGRYGLTHPAPDVTGLEVYLVEADRRRRQIILDERDVGEVAKVIRRLHARGLLVARDAVVITDYALPAILDAMSIRSAVAAVWRAAWRRIKRRRGPGE